MNTHDGDILEKISLKVRRKLISIKVKRREEYYFRRASEIIEEKMDKHLTEVIDGETDLEYYAYLVAIEGWVKAQYFKDKYQLLQDEYNKVLESLQKS